ncbi:hypothetical protein AMC76_00025 [Candidatus Carsonella ruddii]|nr:hypothetical protein AMC76_00025 [Candidatus Carsonella ruddii]
MKNSNKIIFDSILLIKVLLYFENIWFLKFSVSKSLLFFIISGNTKIHENTKKTIKDIISFNIVKLIFIIFI